MEDIKLKVQEASGYLRTAERNMFSGKNQEAVELLNKADEIILPVANSQPNDFQVKSLVQKIEKMRKDLERKGIVTRTGGKKELPFEVNAQLLRIRDCVLNNNLERAQMEMGNYFSRFAGPYSDISEIKELQALIEKMKAEKAEKQQEEDEKAKLQAEERAAHEKLCDEWREKLRTIPYFDGAPQSVPGLAAHVEACAKATEIMNEFGTVIFWNEPDYMLQSLAADIKRRIEMFASNYNKTLGILAGEINQRVENAVVQLNNDTAWQTDTTKVPGFIGEQQMKEFKDSIMELRPACKDNMQVINDLMANSQRLEDMNNESKKARTSAIRMKPEVMDGAAAEPLKQAAAAELERTNPGIVILKIVVTRAWEDRFEEGWEDNTKTKWVKRHFRDATVQIAVKETDGNYRLFSMNIDETKTPGGAYVNIKSHILYSDAIHPENI